MSLNIAPAQSVIEFDSPPKVTAAPLTAMRLTGRNSKGFDAGAHLCVLGAPIPWDSAKHTEGWMVQFVNVACPRLDGKPWDQTPYSVWHMHDKGPCARCCLPFSEHTHMWYDPRYSNACPYIPPPAGPTAILARQRVGGTIGTLDDIP